MQCRPEDGLTGALVGCAWIPGPIPGPSAIVLRADGVHDLSDAVATMRGLLDAADPVALVHAAPGPRVGGIGQLMQNTGPHTPGSSALHRIDFRGITDGDLQALVSKH